MLNSHGNLRPSKKLIREVGHPSYGAEFFATPVFRFFDDSSPKTVRALYNKHRDDALGDTHYEDGEVRTAKPHLSIYSNFHLYSRSTDGPINVRGSKYRKSNTLNVSRWA